MFRIRKLFWDDNNVEHLWQSHGVTPDEVEEIVIGLDDEDPIFRVRRDGDYYVIYGETGSGRLLKMVGEFMELDVFRVFAARDMDGAEKRSYRQGK